MEVGDRDFYIDLFFYHLKLRCYMVIDLKKGEFKPEYAGKMNFYLGVVDDQLCHTDDAPSIGLILCQDRNRIIAEYALRERANPSAFPSTNSLAALPAELESALPTVEQIEAELGPGVNGTPRPKYYRPRRNCRKRDARNDPTRKTRPPFPGHRRGQAAGILRLFPEIRTEGGKIDFERLKLALGETVDVGKERYGMNWPGKAECFKTIQAPSLGTLRPCPEESVNFDTTENLIIEGDNLEVLKLLQKSYLGKVKMIYIDPPYNTGNDSSTPTTTPRAANLPGIHRPGGRRRARSSARTPKPTAASTPSG